MAEQSNSTPQFGPGYSPLSALVMQALRRYGDFYPDTVSSEVLLMFLGFANEIVEDVRSHPYWTGGDISYYEDIEERRPIPDPIIVSGLLMKYAIQQLSPKAQPYSQLYYKTLNSLLYERLYGNEPLQMRVMDGGSNQRYVRNVE